MSCCERRQLGCEQTNFSSLVNIHYGAHREAEVGVETADAFQVSTATKQTLVKNALTSISQQQIRTVTPCTDVSLKNIGRCAVLTFDLRTATRESLLPRRADDLEEAMNR
ncbi:hypothetical protein F2P81_000345 [Scophthalmus maximus]|uniref:Uncharacterized protein n=1 Tax=Scophthalmus maximus TaxID=52904 RepID=A0A6A4TXA3_SCOMX|nr:hypothetical protein F2P81_000345 [Scophthalmus maximus]